MKVVICIWKNLPLTRNSGADGYYMEVSNVKVFDLNSLGGIPSSMVIPPYTASNYAFFAVGNVLYMLDKDTQILSKYLEFDAPITAMDAENMMQNQYVAVGLENGEFHVVNIVNAKIVRKQTGSCVLLKNVLERLFKLVGK